ncbi:MAG: MATE family efflux transporter [Christensenellaceae bacterium]|nr:MATE family efflux transporter [Christensenellaceae bacterium]
MEETVRKENKMGTMPVNKLLVTMALPMIISMIVQALYNIVDSIYVAKLCENALTAVSMSFPVQNFMIAVASGTAVGMNAFLSKSLGEKKFDKANSYATNAIILCGLSCIVIMLFGIFGTRWFFEMQTDIQEIVDYGYNYLSIICIVSFGMFGQIILERVLQSTGKTIFTMFSQGIGAVINIILDPIFIFGVERLNIPALGTAGAAIATVIGQIIAFILAIIFNLKFNTDVKLNFKKYPLQKKIVRNIYKVGVPSIIMMSIGSVMTFLMNQILMKLTETAVAVFGIYFKLQSIIFMPVFGLTNGMIPIVSYNYGAQNRTRIWTVFKLSAMYAAIIMAIGTLIVMFFPEQLLLFFDASEFMLSIGVPALRIMAIPFIVASFCICSSAMFQALNRGVLSLIMSLARQIIVLVPAAFILSRVGGLDLVWYAFPIAEIMSATVVILGLRNISRNILSKLPKETKLLPEANYN